MENNKVKRTQIVNNDPDSMYKFKSIKENAQLNIYYNPEHKDERFFIDAIVEYDKLKADNDRYKVNNETLVNALTDILDLFPEKPKLAISHQVIELASDALEKTNNYGK